MRRISLACVCCFLLSAAAAWGATDDAPLRAVTAAHPAADLSTAQLSASHARSATRTASASSIMFGRRAVASAVAGNGVGMARAFAFRSHMTGALTSIYVYVDHRSSKSRLLAGVYSNSHGAPGSRLSAGSLALTKHGAWDLVKVRPAAIQSGQTYWLVVLGRGGTLYFRHRGGASCAAQPSYQKRLASLPAAWPRSTRSSMCPISAYVKGTRAVRKNGTLSTTVGSTTGKSGGGSASSGGGPSPIGGGSGTSTTNNVLPTIVLPPVNFGAPTISGTAQQGRTLTSSQGTWLDGPTSYAYQWEDCDSLGNGCTGIAGATASTYTLGAGDVGHTIRVVVTASNSAGAGSSTSGQTGVVVAAQPSPPASSAPPSISGSTVQGQMLSTTKGTWTGNPTSYGYQWQDCSASGGSCSNVSGATGSTYTLQSTDVNHTMKVVVTATNSGGSTPASSAASAVVSSSGRSGNGVLLGDQNVASNADSNASGIAQAFAYTATASGTTTDMQLYLNAGTTASELFLGVYSDNAGKPGSLLASGSIGSPHAGAWNDVTIGSATLSAGTTYWIALLGTGGQLNYFDTAGGSGLSYVDSSSNLTSLPQTYAAGNEYNVSPASAYVSGVVSTPPPPPSNTSAPSISGSASQGQTLSASTGSWSNSPTSYGYQWQDCDSSGSNCANIGGATASNYTLQAADVGHTVDVVVTASNAGGSASKASAPTAVVSAASGGGGGGSQIFISQSGAGSGSGADCADAKPVSFFSNSANWGSASGKIGPGVTVDLCGTISSGLWFNGSGTSGNPITVYWQPGATMSSADWGGSSAINTNNNSYITLNGANNGTSIQATAEGTGMADQGVASQGIYALNCNGCMFENLTIANLYVHTSTSDTSVDQTVDNGIVFSGSNITIADNTIHDVGWALYSRWSSGQSNNQIYGNNVYNYDHGFAATASGTNIGPMYFYDNHMHDMANWDAKTSSGGLPYHHDGLHCFGPLGGPAPTYNNGFYIYNNRFDGTVGTEAPTGQFFMEGGTGSNATPCASASSNIYIFNNVVTSSDHVPSNPYMGTAAIAGGIFNNTVIGHDNTTNEGGCGGYSYQQAGASVAYENNVLSTCDQLMTQSGNTSAGDPNGVFTTGSPNHNVYANGGQLAFSCENTQYTFSQFSSWQNCLENNTGGTAPAWDQNSIAVPTANLNTDGSPQTGSPVIGQGGNLTNICTGQPNPGLGALCTTYTGPPAGGTAGTTTTGTTRPTTGSWNAGAY